MYTVYAIRIPAVGRSYFGSTRNMSRRICSHKAQLRVGAHHNVNLQSCFDLVGMGGIVFDTVAEGLRKSQAYTLEEKLIQTAGALNIGLSAVGGDNLTRHPNIKQVIAKRTKAQREALEKLTEDERQALWGRSGEANGMWGQTHGPEVCAAQSVRAQGNQWARGAIRSTEHRKALSLAASQRTGELNPFFGKNHTEETKAHLRQQNIGKKPKNSRPVVCNGVTYPSVTEASRQLSVTPMTIIFRIKSKYWDYAYA